MAVLKCAVVCVVALFATACRTGSEQWGPFQGRVIDAETGAPITAAHVMVLWIREPPGLHFQQWVYDARETVTDRAGRFEIPYERRWFTAWVSEPRLEVFFPGYRSQPSSDAGTIEMMPLKSRSQQCTFEPLGFTSGAHRYVPQFAAALNQYQTSLRCGEGQ